MSRSYRKLLEEIHTRIALYAVKHKRVQWLKMYSSLTQQIGPFTCNIMELYIDQTVGGDRYDKNTAAPVNLL